MPKPGENGRDKLHKTVKEMCMVLIYAYSKELATLNTNSFFFVNLCFLSLFSSLYSSGDFSVIHLWRYVFLLNC